MLQLSLPKKLNATYVFKTFLIMCSIYGIFHYNIFITFQAEIELATVLKELQVTNLDEKPSFSVIARRKLILKSALMALAKTYFT